VHDNEELDGEIADMLADLVRGPEICPSNIRIARRLGIGVWEVQTAFERLRSSGQIDWVIHRLGKDLGRVRVVTLLPSGAQTRLPSPDDHRRRPPDPALEAAKTILRRKGCIVFDCEVTEGKRGRGLIRVDHRRLKRADVLAMAAKVTF